MIIDLHSRGIPQIDTPSVGVSLSSAQTSQSTKKITDYNPKKEKTSKTNKLLSQKVEIVRC